MLRNLRTRPAWKPQLVSVDRHERLPPVASPPGSRRQISGENPGLAAADAWPLPAPAWLGPLGWLSCWGAPGVTGLAVAVAFRRAAGALDRSLPPAALLFTVGICAALVAAGRVRAKAERRRSIAHGLAGTAALASLFLLLWLPGVSAAAIGLAAGVLGASETYFWLRQFGGAVRSAGRGERPAHVRGEACPIESEAAGALQFNEDAWQVSQRRLLKDGSEMVAGTIRVQFMAGERTAAAHFAFCPPFAERPRVSVRRQAGAPARVRATQVIPQGARFEVRREGACESPAEVAIAFTAASPPSALEGTV